MTKVSISGIFGDNDSHGFDCEEPYVSFNLFSEGDGRKNDIGFYLDKLTDENIYPSEIGVDFLVLAAHVFSADRTINRVDYSQDGWTREIRLIVPVSKPKLWINSKEKIEKMLLFLTGDIWQVDFRARPQDYAELVDRPRFRKKVMFKRVNLFSGGLDSLIGAIDNIEKNRSQILINHADDSFVVTVQNNCFDALKYPNWKEKIIKLPPWRYNMGNLFDDSRREYTSRGRSFLFFSLATAVGTALDVESFTINVPENGFISLNVPLEPLRIGALSTRTTHPYFMTRWNELLENLGIYGKLKNPYWNKTKREMVEGCLNQELLRETVNLSVSCSSARQGRYVGESPGHCGTCVPCIIRRSALLRFGDPTEYRIPNLNDETLNSMASQGKHIRSFQVAISRIKMNKNIAEILIHQSGPLDDFIDRYRKYAEVYRRGLEEVHELLKSVQTKPFS